MNEIEYKEWANEFPLLASIPARNPFTVPAGYFNNAASEATTQFTLEMFRGKQFNSGFTVPEGYFEMLTDQLLARIEAEKFRTKNTGFALPENYFEGLTNKILAQTTEAAKTTEAPKAAKVIKLWHTDLMKYASAACVLLVTAATLFFSNQQYKLDQSSTSDLRQTSVSEYNEQMLYDIDEEMIIDHINGSESHKKDVASMPSAQIENYILDNYSTHDIEQGL